MTPMLVVAVVVSQRTKRRQAVSGFVSVLWALARNADDDAPAALVVTTRKFAAVKATTEVVVDWFPFASSS